MSAGYDDPQRMKLLLLANPPQTALFDDSAMHE